MRKSKLTDGTPFLGINVEHFVTKLVFVRALADDYWERSEEFDLKMKKTTGYEILKRRLFFKGNKGVETSGWDGAAEEFMKPYREAFEASTKRVEKNYSYLK